ncbi:hypothetical protein HU200_019567 [Digitaria exilis]|uniref:Uncharacterized protein n=1 Tax=Digitaria exilis TaxID=1010633 RepID=A0A835F3Q7_9POAL|nr:hypothetical protein HU200_019567 [Digitaria exilis]
MPLPTAGPQLHPCRLSPLTLSSSLIGFCPYPPPSPAPLLSFLAGCRPQLLSSAGGWTFFTWTLVEAQEPDTENHSPLLLLASVPIMASLVSKGGEHLYYPAGSPPPSSPQDPTWVVVGFGNGLPTAPPQQGHHLEESSQLATTTTTIPLYTDPNHYYVEVTGLRVGYELGFPPDGTGGPYTYLESNVFLWLKAALMSQIQRLNTTCPPINIAWPTQASLDPAGKLCYVRPELMVPPTVILFAINAAMRLGAATNVWYREGPSTVCLAILPMVTS